jgi:hypothetical protein
MDDRADNQNLGATRKFATLDWPTPEMLQAANRARAKAVCDMILALGKWAKASMASHLISKPSRDKAVQAQSRPPIRQPVGNAFAASCRPTPPVLEAFRFWRSTWRSLVAHPASAVTAASRPRRRGEERS